WIPSVPYFQWMCFAGIFISLAVLNVNCLDMQGKCNYTLRLELGKFALAALVLWQTYAFGILAIIYAQLAVRLLFYGLNTLVIGRVYGYRLWKQLQDILPPFLASLADFLAVWGVSHLLADVPLLLLLAIQGVLFVGLYLTVI